MANTTNSKNVIFITLTTFKYSPKQQKYAWNTAPWSTPEHKCHVLLTAKFHSKMFCWKWWCDYLLNHKYPHHMFFCASYSDMPRKTLCPSKPKTNFSHAHLSFHRRKCYYQNYFKTWNFESFIWCLCLALNKFLFI